MTVVVEAMFTAMSCASFILTVIFTHPLTVLAARGKCFDVWSVVQKDTYMDSSVYRKVIAASLYQCASECLMSSTCLSFSYKHHTCHLNSNTSDHVDVITGAGSVFSDIHHWPQRLAGPCATAQVCPAMSRCLVDRLGQTSCAPDIPCGSPPVVDGATRETEGQFHGATSKYTCIEDYKQCDAQTTSVCQSTGEWDALSGLCGLYRWRNPEVGVLYRLPCGASSDMHLRITATPTKTTRCTVDIRSGMDVLCHISFRLDSLGDVKTTIFNTKTNGAWGTEERADMTLLVAGQEAKISIFLDAGVYQIMVDGTTIYNFTERTQGAKPDSFILGSDIQPHLIADEV
ncbi:uncharacterized protein LOC124258095 [Haliotis rubra]|uniref:uncharacterized protein LOC124258095 n=1 Tax=Haliotis rubra TaxID=36100 RepID=UPI001EE5D948|nr:uncharacterized protein LOC124258095 [Haliotis rubra]